MIVFEGPGDILQSAMQTIVIPVNTVAVMGKGLALQARFHFPGLEQAYRQACLNRDITTHGFFIYFCAKHQKRVVCLPTKYHWRDPSPLKLVDDGLYALSYALRHDQEFESLALPAVGCGLGGLDWTTVVRPLIVEYFGERFPKPVEVYTPD